MLDKPMSLLVGSTVCNQSRKGCFAVAISADPLMFDQNGFGDDSPETSGLSEANNRCDEMDDENEQIAHNSSYSGQNPPKFRAKLEFARHRFTITSWPMRSATIFGSTPSSRINDEC